MPLLFTVTPCLLLSNPQVIYWRQTHKQLATQSSLPPTVCQTALVSHKGKPSVCGWLTVHKAVFSQIWYYKCKLSNILINRNFCIQWSHLENYIQWQHRVKHIFMQKFVCLMLCVTLFRSSCTIEYRKMDIIRKPMQWAKKLYEEI